MASNLQGLSANPLLQNHLRAVDAALRAGDMAGATKLAAEATARGFEHPNLLVLAAYDGISRGDDDKALALATRAQALSPRNPDALNVAGICLARLGRQREALTAFEAALRQQPGAAHIRLRKAMAHEDLGELTKARVELERMLDSDPGNGEALARLANLAALRGDAKAARDHATRALKRDPSQQSALLSLAMADLEEKKFEEALSRVTPLASQTNPSAVNRSIALSLAGDALDGLAKPQEAFTAYVASKAVLHAFYRNVYEAAGTETALARAERLTAYFQHADPAQWRASRGGEYGSPVETHVFLVGFPRSGTTLLESVLDAHPDVRSMDERDCLSAAVREFIPPPDGLARLAQCGTGALASFRDAYWHRAAEEGFVPDRKLFVDKLPLNSILLPLVAKLFPRAKIIFALRDPRDVVFSCFRRRFAMSAQMYEFTSLESAARYYDAVMRLCTLYREKLGLPTFDLRYESLVSGFDAALGALCAFLGIAPDAAMADFAARAKARNVDTPSNAQLARGLYRQGIGQWRAYAGALKPVLPLLQPWVAHYGYED